IKANVKVAFKDWFSFLIKQRLYYKMEIIKEQLRRSNNNWEAVLFQLLAKYFGSGLNSEAFYTMALQLDFKMVQKLKQDPLALEALFFGITGLFNKTADDEYYNQLKTTYSFLRRKFELENHQLIPLRFFRLRPASFPTIRLSQLAQLYSKSNGLFEQLTTSQDLDLLRNVFEIKASEFWNDHYRFEVVSKHRPKNLSVNFINSILINVVIPLQYVYHETKGKSFINRGLNLMRQIPAESNSILSGFKGLGIELEHAYDTQSLLHLYNNYCSKNNCLECDIGNEILNRNM
ncbi:MAG: DUF2851 family protein, partial [Bacteroidia bacterium]|nr:DUF2851 family protein [Bacteroidia bacterium]